LQAADLLSLHQGAEFDDVGHRGIQDRDGSGFIGLKVRIPCREPNGLAMIVKMQSG